MAKGQNDPIINDSKGDQMVGGFKEGGGET